MVLDDQPLEQQNARRNHDDTKQGLTAWCPRMDLSPNNSTRGDLVRLLVELLGTKFSEGCHTNYDLHTLRTPNLATVVPNNVPHQPLVIGIVACRRLALAINGRLFLTTIRFVSLGWIRSHRAQSSPRSQARKIDIFLHISRNEPNFDVVNRELKERKCYKYLLSASWL